MEKYGKIINETTKECIVGLGTDIKYYQKLGYILLDVTKSNKDMRWYLSSVIDNEANAKQEILNLKMSPREFLLILTVVFSVPLEYIKQFKNAFARAEIELDYATFIERANSMLDMVASQFSLTPEMLDDIFVNKEMYMQLVAEADTVEVPIVLDENEPPVGEL